LGNDPSKWRTLLYKRHIENGRETIHFLGGRDLELQDLPLFLPGAAALAVVDGFDIRSAVYLIYAAHATQLEKQQRREIVVKSAD